jgi:ribulose-5-phosphate 4-epimerase/fuculose-1-phosphate aldolase
MVQEKPLNIPFQTFFMSREVSKCPLISDIIKIGKKINSLGLENPIDAVISLSYGKRILINSSDVNLINMSNHDILEIVDYDPIKNVVLAMGKQNPVVDTPVHWIIHHAREDVNAIIQLNGEMIIKQFLEKNPITETEYPSGTVELAKEVLKTIKISKKIVIRNIGCLFVGINLNEVENLIFKGDERIDVS